MSNKKAADLIPKIIGAKDQKEAIEVLNDTLKALHLNSDYTELVALKDKLDDFQQQFKDIEHSLRELTTPREYTDLKEIRHNLAFLYRDVSDELSFEINAKKVWFGEDKRTTVKAQSILEVKRNHKDISDSGAKEIYGETELYQQYLKYYHYAYGLYKELNNLLESIKLLSDSVASEASHALHIEKKDVK